MEPTIAPGVFPYRINAQPWADHALAERFVAVPNGLTINTDSQSWSFPKNSVLVKTLSLDMHSGEVTSRRRVETQILHFDGVEWMPYTYQWNDDQTDATLVEANGAERTFEIIDSIAAGGLRKQRWRFAGRAECQRCHNRWSGPVLGFNPPQLTRNHNYAGITTSQLETFAQIKLIGKRVEEVKVEKLVDPRDDSASLDDRARAYLHTNCAHCHRMHAGGAVLSHMHFDLPLDKTNMVHARPSQGTFNIHGAEVIAPGDPFRSVLLYRIAKLGNGRMPRIGSTEVDRAGVELIGDWLEQMPDQRNPPADRDKSVAKLRGEEAAALVHLLATEKATEKTEIVDRLLSSTAGAMRLLRSVDDGEMSTILLSMTIEKGASHSDVTIRDLFEPFLSAEDRAERLGSSVHPDQILMLSGDEARGREVFFETSGVSCKECHRITGEGKELGPDLTTIGSRLSREQLLEGILEPSIRIDPKYVTYLVETTSGQILTGLLLEKGESEVILKDAQNNVHHIAQEEIEVLVPRRQSLMPDLLVQEMTAQQVADLLAYLGSLK